MVSYRSFTPTWKSRTAGRSEAENRPEGGLRPLKGRGPGMLGKEDASFLPERGACQKRVNAVLEEVRGPGCRGWCIVIKKRREGGRRDSRPKNKKGLCGRSRLLPRRWIDDSPDAQAVQKRVTHVDQGRKKGFRRFGEACVPARDYHAGIGG